ncbi:hypothetical protein FRC12_007516 [Ceratobasidium sp. 428]|nr:hypothetical protein FRC12_007516 [Ceratobasidium sp. 428]
MGFNPSFDFQDLPALRKPFTPALGLLIASFKSPYYEGSGGLFFRLSGNKDDKRVGLLTCAHVSHPRPLFENQAYTRKKESQPREDVLLGGEAFNKAVRAITEFIGNQVDSISSWESTLSKIPVPVENEAPRITQKRDELVGLISAAKKKIEAAKELHSDVTKNLTLAETRVFGFMLHCAKVEVNADDHFMNDWSLIQVDDDKVDWAESKGNRLFVGGNKTAADWKKYMFPQANYRHGFHAPEDMLLPVKDYVPEAELRSPQNLDIHNVKTLLAVKNGRTTGTTFGRVNGLESVTRKYTEYDVNEKALEFIVCGHDTVTGDNANFSDDGDSGSFVVGRDGRLIGQLTGGAGPTDKADRSYMTPFWALKRAMDKEFPGCHPIPADAYPSPSMPSLGQLLNSSLKEALRCARKGRSLLGGCDLSVVSVLLEQPVTNE